MTPNSLDDELSRCRATARRQQTITLLLSAVLVVSLLIHLLSIGSMRTTIVPPVIDRAFWVSGNKVSREYLELMGPFVASLILDVSPGSITYKRDQLLKWVRPEQHGEIKLRMDKEADRLRALNASTVFQVHRIAVDDAAFSVRLDGLLSTFINAQKPTETEESYLLQFGYDGGTLALKSFEKQVKS
ncbi:MAG: type IV conjugative transfer system protein TraE [Betaproteobacteria bacterium]|nr:type IV conjugative transfer system protein TraE [Betaproteobacteria bacterium]